MQNVKARMNAAANSVNAEVHQLDQTPSCGGLGTKDKPFQDRYRLNVGKGKSISFFYLISVHPTCRFYGKNYPRLLKIKKYWDPENIINHCYSVGSTDQECCVKDN